MFAFTTQLKTTVAVDNRDILNGQARILEVTPLSVPLEHPSSDVPLPAKPLPMPVVEEGGSLWDALTSVYNYTRIGVVMTPILIRLIFGVIMKNWKTTLGAIIAAIATLLNMTGIVTIPADVQTGLLAVALFIVGIFSSDAKKEE